MSHANAQLTPAGRLRLAQLVVDKGWAPCRRAAKRRNCSVTTAKRWVDRYRAEGRAGMVDRSSRPRTSPRRTPSRVERRVLGLRVARRWGPARIADRLWTAVSMVQKVLRRFDCPPLSRTRSRDRLANSDTCGRTIEVCRDQPRVVTGPVMSRLAALAMRAATSDTEE
ncbi:helix-turn-helix domain-containing protein [Nocardioides sp. YIM 123512]|uniref:Helix-turn-helix domain-containing protein n=1 Tax=Nocardioides flavescens TaxID=2691959 RepID=A0A6L7EM79_9ACTN|nr:helix-turn-helix domain-containing protein [Nocardioides flavescens]